MNKQVLALDQGRVNQTQIWANPNFSFKEVLEPIEIPQAEQMIVNNSIRVESELRIEGEAYVCQFPEVEPFPELPDDNFSFFEVTGFEEVKSGQEMVLTQFLKVDGMLKVSGFVSLFGTEPENETDFLIPNKIGLNQVYKIAQDFEHYFRGFLNNSGALRVSGSFIVGA